MIDVNKLIRKSEQLEVFLDQAEKHCNDLKFGSYIQPDSINKKTLLAQREGLIKILLMFRPESEVLNEYEKSKESLWH